MAYFPVDDDVAFHPKVLAAGNEALGMWTRAGALCKKHTTGGFVTTETARALGPKKLADRLVAAGLWVVTDGGYYFHDWTDQAGNGTADEEKERRDRNLERNSRRQAIFRDPKLRQAIRDRDGDGCRYCGREVNWHDRRGERGGTYDHVDPEGPNTLDNLVVSCRSCGSAKGRRTPEAAGMPLRDPAPGQIGSSSDLDQSLVGPNGPSPSPSPSPMTEPIGLTEIGPVPAARERTDLKIHLAEDVRLAAFDLGIRDLREVMDRLSAAYGRPVTGEAALAYSRLVLSRAAREPTHPGPYVLAAIDQHPDEAASYLDWAGVAA